MEVEKNKAEPRVVVIGGGTGSFTLLSGLKHFVDDLTALVNMADDGGSSGVLRDELGVLPPGDIRQCLVALSDSPKIRELFTYRFTEGSLEGHSFGNLFISAVEKMTDDFEEAVRLASEVLHIHGKVLPITLSDSKLVATMSDGHIIRDQHNIGNVSFGKTSRPKLQLEPASKLTQDAKAAILRADIVVIAPGNLYGSLAPALLVDGMKEALKSTKAKIIYVSNLVTKPGQTDGFLVHDYVEEIERFIGASVVDYVIFNTDEPPKQLLDKYVRDGEFIVEFNLEEMDKKHYVPIGLPLIAKEPTEIKAGDKIAHVRSLIRHDGIAVSREVMKLFFS